MNGLPARLLLTLIAAAALIGAEAATPPSGTLTDASGPVTYSAGPFALDNPTPIPEVDSGPECNNPQQPCDEFYLTVTLPAGYAAAHPGEQLRFTQSWTDSTGTGESDYDLYVYPGTVTTLDGSKTALAESNGSANPEVCFIPVADGTRAFTVISTPFVSTGEVIHVTVDLVQGPASGGTTGFGQATPTAPGVPRYQNFFPPAGSAADGSAGEFSIGFDPESGNVLTLSDLNTFRVTPPELRNPPLPAAGPALWTDVSPGIINGTTLDPILFTDQATGRTFESMQTTGAEALFGYSDDDGASWIQASAAPPNGGADHETVGAGPYPALLPAPNPLYPNAVYYCSQDVVGPAMCQRSDDGGASFGPGLPIYFGNGVTACGGLHGHVKVGPDGAVYVPAAQCGTLQGGSVSLDAGNTWSNFTVPGSQSFTSGGSTDPSIAIGQDDTAYYCYVDGAGAEHHVHVAVSHDHGASWTDDADIGAPVGVVMAVFPEAVAGSPGRAACGFLGSDVAGDHESPSYPGIWYLFIATTYDGGQTWVTVNATPNDPVQGAGGIWNSGGGQQNRNLLDFNETTMDSRGRVLFGYDDGCVSAACLADPTKNDFTAYERVARQTGGKTLLAQFDPVEPAAPQAPYLQGTRSATQAVLNWTPPDNGGAAITAYEILRGTASGGEKKLATVLGSKTSYTDARTKSGTAQYFYEVEAINAQGTGPASNELALAVAAPPPSPCNPPGPTLLTDAAGDSLTGTPGTDLLSFQLAQPYAADGDIKLRFQLNTDPGQANQPPDSYWYVSFKEPDGDVHGVRMVYPVGALAPAFESYIAAPNSSGIIDGRFVQSGSEKPADPSSFYDFSNGRIVIAVPLTDLGLAPGGIIGGFNAAAVQSVNTPAGGVAETADEMPDGLGYQGSYTVNANTACTPQK
ncbi:MAG TPA: fibronectin type III domain-containing protein [Gammaproteobacteria bacterium]|nr:fibronectin type III domain-containing protein [Gammaproteobacteria bacterium]